MTPHIQVRRNPSGTPIEGRYIAVLRIARFTPKLAEGFGDTPDAAIQAMIEAFDKRRSDDRKVQTALLKGKQIIDKGDCE